MKNQHTRALAAFGLALATVGCTDDSPKHRAEEEVRQNLKDPDSARFGELYFNEKTEKGCLTVNAKNSMGGYTGDQQALVIRNGGGWKFVSIDEDTFGACHEWADTPYEGQQL